MSSPDPRFAHPESWRDAWIVFKGDDKQPASSAPPTVAASCLDVGLALVRNGLSTVPPTQDGEKMPFGPWKQYQVTPPTEEQVRAWYKTGRTGVGAVTGVGGLECFEFDCRETYDQFLLAAEAVGLGDLVMFIRKGYEEDTPGGGAHWLYLCDELRGSTKLAERPDPTDATKRKTLIESRGEGAYVILAPSNGKVHPTGGAYQLRQGGIEHIVTLTSDQRDELWDLARTFDEIPEQPAPSGPPKAPPKAAGAGNFPDTGKSPGDDFEERASWEDVLEPFGWTKAHTSGQATYWRRSGKDRGWSATTGHCKGLKVFSTSTPFDTKGTHTKFHAYVVLNHQGDYQKAVPALVQAGYGTWIDHDGTEKPNPPPKGWRRTGGTAQPPANSPIIGKGGRWLSCLLNYRLWLEDPRHQNTIRYDQFRHEVLVNGAKLTDEMVISLTVEIEADTRAGWAQDHVRSAVLDIAGRNVFSSLTEWLGSLQWDGNPRVGSFFKNAFGCEDNSYNQTCGKVFFLTGAARAFQPGCQADVMVVLIGPQGLGKSTGMASLCPNPEWYADDLGCGLFDRKAGEGLRGKWLVEFSEFSRINRATLDVVKSFVTRRSDYYRPAYARTHKDFPRTCFFVGTTNDAHPLHDQENRRFMPIECVKADFDWITKYRDQLWAEAVHRFKAGENWWVSDPTLLQEVVNKQDQARQQDCWVSILESEIGHLHSVKMEDAARALQIKPDRLDRSAQILIRMALKEIGFARTRVREEGKLCYT